MTRAHVAAARHAYAQHLEPIFDALPEARRGRRWALPGLTRDGWAHGRPPDGAPVVVAAHRDLVVVRGRNPVAFAEHGAGQRYLPYGHSAYVGGRDRAGVGLLLCQSERVAAINAEAHPVLRRAVVGCPWLDVLRTARKHYNPYAAKMWRVASGIPGAEAVADPLRVVLAWHADLGHCSETRSAWTWWRRDLRKTGPDLDGLRLALTAHPRAAGGVSEFAARHGFDWYGSLVDVVREADVVCADNTSALFEAAAVGIPVVAINAPIYRRDVHHGLRFWEHIPGPQIASLGGLADAVRAVADTQAERWADVRTEVTGHVYAHADVEAAPIAAAAVLDWVDDGCHVPIGAPIMADQDPYRGRVRFPPGHPRNTTQTSGPQPTVQARQVTSTSLDLPDTATEAARWIGAPDDPDEKALRARFAAIQEGNRDRIRVTVRRAVDAALEGAGQDAWDWGDDGE